MTVIELTSFTTKEEFSADQVLAAIDNMQPDLEQVDGYISRKVLRLGDRQWIDIVEWSDKEKCEAAMQAMMTNDKAGQFFVMIEEESIDMQQYPAVRDFVQRKEQSLKH